MRDRETRLLSAHTVPMKGAVCRMDCTANCSGSWDARTTLKIGDPLRSGSSAQELGEWSDTYARKRCHDFGLLCSGRFTKGKPSLCVQWELWRKWWGHWSLTWRLAPQKALSQSDSVVDRTCSRLGQQVSGRSRWEKKFRTCQRETVQWRHSPICQSRYDETCWKDSRWSCVSKAIWRVLRGNGSIRMKRSSDGWQMAWWSDRGPYSDRNVDVTIEMLSKLMAVSPWDSTAVIRAGADGGHHDGQNVIPGQAKLDCQ